MCLVQGHTRTISKDDLSSHVWSTLWSTLSNRLVCLEDIRTWTSGVSQKPRPFDHALHTIDINKQCSYPDVYPFAFSGVKQITLPLSTTRYSLADWRTAGFLLQSTPCPSHAPSNLFCSFTIYPRHLKHTPDTTLYKPDCRLIWRAMGKHPS